VKDKSKLLNQLKIDRSEDDASTGISTLIVIILVCLALIVGATGSYFYFGTTADPTDKPGQMAEVPSAISNSDTNQTIAQENTSTETIAQPEPDRILNASGYITARRIATVSAEIMGLLTDVLVEEGMSVKSGQVLAHLDSAIADVNLKFSEAQVSVQKARLESDIANLDEAKRVLERVSELNANEYSSAADLTRSQASVETLAAQVKRTKADIEVAELEASRQRERLNDHTIRAPFGGVVTVKNAQPGEIVSPSSAGGGFTRTGICTIVDMSSLEIEVDVNEAFIGRVFEGQKVEANLDAYPDWTIPASVIAIIPTADRAKATVRVRIRIEEPDKRILPDMGVKVAFLKA
jgi:RND family efflux transporter MFP subunit